MYALVALGFTLILGVLHRLNLAHGDVFVLGGFVALGATNQGLSIWLAAPLAIIVGGVLGILVGEAAEANLLDHHADDAAALSSVAFGIVVIDLIHKVWGTEPVALNLAGLGSIHGFAVFGVRVTTVEMIIVAITIALMVALHLLVTQTRMGRNIRAVADNPQSATLLGINVRAVSQLSLIHI